MTQYADDACYYAYKTTVNGTVCHEAAYPGDKWARIADASEYRGGVRATLERRLISFQDCSALFPCLQATDANGRDIWVSGWEEIARVDSHEMDLYQMARY